MNVFQVVDEVLKKKREREMGWVKKSIPSSLSVAHPCNVIQP
jgi:hypothetical protein